MDSYIIDEQVLGDFVDALLKEKYPGEPVEAHAEIKEQAKKDLDHQVLKAILGGLTQEQGTELNRILKENSSDEEAFASFFEEQGINLEKVITDAMASFKEDFMKGAGNAN